MTSISPERRRPINVGLYIPNGDGYMAAGIHQWKQILELARAAEDAGFDSVWVADHMIFNFEGEAAQGRWECWSLLAALAASTSRVQIGPLVTCMGFRNPALLAKIAETVDEISGGRLILGLGAGWHEPEFTTYGFPYDHRASRFEEGFTVVHALLKTGTSDFHGEYVQTQACVLQPRGPRPGGIPLMLGTDGPRLLRTAARYADSWNTTWVASPDAIAPLRTQVDAACLEVGRDPTSLGRSACIFIDMPNRVGRELKPARPTPPVTGPAQAADVIREYAGEGLDHVMVWLDPNSVAGVAAFAPALAMLDQG